jgi:hypothetical protein
MTRERRDIVRALTALLGEQTILTARRMLARGPLPPPDWLEPGDKATPAHTHEAVSAPEPRVAASEVPRR